MQVLDMPAHAGDLRSMARELGISASPEASGAAALAPAVLGGFKKQTQGHPANPAGHGDLLGRMLGGGGGGQAGAGTASSGLSGLASMLDMNGDGNPMDDTYGSVVEVKGLDGGPCQILTDSACQVLWQMSKLTPASGFALKVSFWQLD